MISPLLPEQNQNPRTQGDDRQNDTNSETGKSDNADSDEIDGKQEHSNVFGKVHAAIMSQS
jgi:hypothetical protein